VYPRYERTKRAWKGRLVRDHCGNIKKKMTGGNGSLTWKDVMRIYIRGGGRSKRDGYRLEDKKFSDLGFPTLVGRGKPTQ